MEHLTLTFESEGNERHFLLTTGEELTKSLERGYVDLCAESSRIINEDPAVSLVEEISNERSAGYPVLIELDQLDKRLVPISSVKLVHFQDEKNLRNQQQSISSMHSISSMNTAVHPNMFLGESQDVIPPPVGDDQLLARLERRSAAVMATVVARKSQGIGGEFINAVLKGEPSQNSLIRAIANLRHGKSSSEDKTASFLKILAENMIELDGGQISPSKMLDIVNSAFIELELKDEISIRVLEDLKSFSGSLAGRTAEARSFTPIPLRIDDSPASDIYAIANLIVMRPQLSDLLEWPVAEHGSNEDQFMTAAYLLGLTEERRLLPATMRPMALDDVLVIAISDALANNLETIPDTHDHVKLSTRPSGGLSINGSPVNRFGPTWEIPATAPPSKPESTSPSKNEQIAPPQDELSELIDELSQLLEKGLQMLSRLGQVARSQRAIQAETPEKSQRSASPSKPAASKKSKVGSAALPHVDEKDR